MEDKACGGRGPSTTSSSRGRRRNCSCRSRRGSHRRGPTPDGGREDFRRSDRVMTSNRIGYRRGEGAPDLPVRREWLVTNGLGGYASGTLAGTITRRYHGLLVAALPNPLGRTMMFNQLIEWVSGAGDSP